MKLSSDYDSPDVIECYTCNKDFYKVGLYGVKAMMTNDEREILIICLSDGTDYLVNYSNICWVRRSNGKKDNLLNIQPKSNKFS